MILRYTPRRYQRQAALYADQYSGVTLGLSGSYVPPGVGTGATRYRVGYRWRDITLGGLVILGAGLGLFQLLS